MRLAAGIRPYSTVTTPTLSTKVIDMPPMLIITMSTEPPGRRRQGALT